MPKEERPRRSGAEERLRRRSGACLWSPIPAALAVPPVAQRPLWPSFGHPGDGTCGWLMTAMENVGCTFPLATMPLGTGNDLARTLRWGHGLTGSMRREQWLRRVARANIVGLDRWCASPPDPGLGLGPGGEGEAPRVVVVWAAGAWVVGARVAGARARGRGWRGRGPGLRLVNPYHPTPTPNPTRRVRLYDCKEQITGLPPTFVAGQQTPASSTASSSSSAASTAREYNGVFNNYMGLGIEAHAIYAFHKAREANPERFSGRLKNQALMGALGLPTTGLCGCCCPAPQLKPRLKLSVRRATAQGGAGAAHISPWEEVELPSHLKAIILVNIPSHSAGAYPWGSARSAVPQDYADGIIEVVGTVNALHGLAYLSLNKALHLRRGPGCFKRLAQAAEVRLELLEPLHVQVDGEPWLQPAGTFAISCKGKSNVRPLIASAQPALRPDPEPSNPSLDPSPAHSRRPIPLSGAARAHREGVAPQPDGTAQEAAGVGPSRGPCHVAASRGH